MDTNENLQQINTFTGGMDTDTSDMHVQPNTYRMARNLRLGLADDGKTGELKKIYGTKLEKFYDEDGQELQFTQIIDINAYKNLGLLIAESEYERTVYPEYVEVDLEITARNEYRGQNRRASLYFRRTRFVNDNDLDVSILVYLDINFIYVVDGVEQQITKTISALVPNNATAKNVAILDDGDTGYVKYINSVQNIYFYPSDNNMAIINYQIGIIDYDEQNFENTYTTDEYSVTKNEKYPYTTIDKKWSIYRFNTESNVCKRIFGPSGDSLNYPDVTSYFVQLTESKITAYIQDSQSRQLSVEMTNPDYDLPNWYENIPTKLSAIYTNPSPILFPIKVSIKDSTNGSTIPPGINQYVYILSNDEDKYSRLSPFSNPVIIRQKSDIGDAGGWTATLRINIPDVSIFTRITVYRVSYTGDNGTVNVYKIIDERQIDGSATFDFDDNDGTLIPEQVQLSELASMLQLDPIYKAQDTAYIGKESITKFIGNTVDSGDAVNDKFVDVDVRSFTQGSYYYNGAKKIKILDDNGNIKNLPDSNAEIYNPTFDTNANPLHTYEPQYWVKKTSTDGNRVLDVQKLSTYFGGTGEYFDWHYEVKTRTYSYGNYDSDAQWKAEQNNISYTYPGTFMPGEIYRFGVILYDKEFGKSSVKWMCDIQIPILDVGYIDNATQYITITFTLKKEIPNCSYFNIVRCIRTIEKDTITLSTGVALPLDDGKIRSSLLIENVNYPSLNRWQFATYFAFFSPEFSCGGADDIRNKYYDVLQNAMSASKLSMVYDVYTTHPDTAIRTSFMGASIPTKNFIPKHMSISIDNVTKIDTPAPSEIVPNGETDVNFGATAVLFGETSVKRFQEEQIVISPGNYYQCYMSIGNCVAIKASQPIQIKPYNADWNYLQATIVHVCGRLVRRGLPYGGYNINAINASTYYDFGCFFKNTPGNHTLLQCGDSFVLTGKHELASVWPVTVPLKNNYNAMNHYPRRIYYPDCYTNLPVFVATDPPALINSEQHLALLAKSGYSIYRNETEKTNNTPYTQAWTPLYIQKQFLNKAGEGSLSNFSVKILKYSSVEKPFRIQYTYLTADTKSETYETDDYIDLDPKYGEITHLKVYKTRLYFWQTNAFGYISLNEKPLYDASQKYLSTEENPQNISVFLGSGDLINLPIYVSTQIGMNYGNKILCETKSAMYWYSKSINDIVKYSIDGGVQLLSSNNSIKKYFLNATLTNKQYAMYRGQYDEILFNFSNNESLVYNEQMNKFTGVYDYTITGYAIMPTRILLYNDKYAFEDNVKGSDTIYDQPFDIYLSFVVNNRQQYVKVYNNIQMALNTQFETDIKDKFMLVFKTPLNQTSELERENITDRELDYRAAIPRAGKYGKDGFVRTKYREDGNFATAKYGDRMRGKTMEVELYSDSEDFNVSIQYIITKYSISWS